MISHKYKCIFIHIPKTAGTSIEYALDYYKELGLENQEEFREQDHRTISDIKPISISDMIKYYNEHKKIGYGRRYFRQFTNHPRYVSEKQYNSYFKFTFVRNPYGKVFSWYKHVIKDEIHQRNLGVNKVCTFKNFVENYLDTSVSNSQFHWIKDKDNKIPMDFIGRFENLKEDFAYVCKVLEIENKELPHILHGGNKKKYIEFYDQELIEIVSNKYREEIDYFGYNFGD